MAKPRIKYCVCPEPSLYEHKAYGGAVIAVSCSLCTLPIKATEEAAGTAPAEKKKAAKSVEQLAMDRDMAELISDIERETNARHGWEAVALQSIRSLIQRARAFGKVPRP